GSAICRQHQGSGGPSGRARTDRDRSWIRRGHADRCPSRCPPCGEPFGRPRTSGEQLMEVVEQLFPYIGWIIAGAIAISLGGIFASVHNTRMKIKHGYPMEGMWGQSLKPEMTTEAMERVKIVTQENASLRAELAS